MAYNLQPRAFAQLFEHALPEAPSLAQDRKVLALHALRQRPNDAAALPTSYLRRLSR
jgi:hypothetical protein